MAWTAPLTAVAHTAFNASDFNSSVRDNLRETMPGKSTYGPNGGYFVVSGPNEIVQRPSFRTFVNAIGSTTSATFTDLGASFGPSVALPTGQLVLVGLTADLVCTNSGTPTAIMGFEVTGATSVSAALSRSIGVSGAGGQYNRVSALFVCPTLNPGTNTFTAKYRASSAGNTASFRNREMNLYRLD